MEKLLTLKETAKYLRVSERSVLRYIKAGRLEASRIGQWRIKENSLNKFLVKHLNVKKDPEEREKLIKIKIYKKL